jgi:hypothetical protein
MQDHGGLLLFTAGTVAFLLAAVSSAIAVLVALD